MTHPFSQNRPEQVLALYSRGLTVQQIADCDGKPQLAPQISVSAAYSVQ